MNKMLVVIFDTHKAADSGMHALRKLHDEGDVTLCASAVIARDAKCKVSVKEATHRGGFGAGVGLAVGALVGMMGGTAGIALGAVTGTVAWAIRDFWVVGVDLVEEAQKMLQPGKAALVGVDEEWVVPVGSALAATRGVVYRRTRSEVVDAQFDRGIAVFRSEIEELNAEAANATGTARTKLQTQIVGAKTGLARAMQHAQQGVEVLKLEADGKKVAIEEQVSHARGDVKARLQDHVKRVKSAYQLRSVKLSQTWGLTKAGLAV